MFHLYSAGKERQRWRCKRCVVSLHFHHVMPVDKSFAVTVASGKSLDAYRAEARKCVLVCANCHGEIEARLIESPPPRARFEAA